MSRVRDGKYFPELREVLTLINRGRLALKLKPLGEIPKGIPDDEDKGPVGLAFNGREFHEGDGCLHCTPVTMSMPCHRQAMALSKAWGTCFEDNLVRLPEELRRFHLEFVAGKYLSLVDRSVVTDEEIAEQVGGCDAFDVRSLVCEGLIECAGYGWGGERVYFARTMLESTLSRVKRLLSGYDRMDSPQPKLRLVRPPNRHRITKWTG